MKHYGTRHLITLAASTERARLYWERLARKQRAAR